MLSPDSVNGYTPLSVAPLRCKSAHDPGPFLLLAAGVGKGGRPPKSPFSTTALTVGCGDLVVVVDVVGGSNVVVEWCIVVVVCEEVDVIVLLNVEFVDAGVVVEDGILEDDDVPVDDGLLVVDVVSVDEGVDTDVTVDDG